MSHAPLTRWQYAIRSSRLSGTARGVAWALSLRMDTVTLECTPGVKRIASESGWSESTVHKALAELRGSGYLFVVYRGYGTRQQSNLYRGTFPKWLDSQPQEKNDPGF